MELDWVETSMSRDVLIQASMLPDAVRNANEDEVGPHHIVVNVLDVCCIVHKCQNKCDNTAVQ